MFSMSKLGSAMTGIGREDNNAPAGNMGAQNPYGNVGGVMRTARSMFNRKPQQSGSMIGSKDTSSLFGGGGDLFGAGNSFAGNYGAPQSFGGRPNGNMMDYFKSPSPMVSPAALQTPQPMFGQPSFMQQQQDSIRNKMGGNSGFFPSYGSGGIAQPSPGVAQPQGGSFFNRYQS